jgi:Fe-S cluster assembly scaffold protein SufB
LPSVVFLPEIELVALDNAQIKYSNVQNWYPGSATTRGKERCAKAAAAACCRRPP